MCEWRSAWLASAAIALCVLAAPRLQAANVVEAWSQVRPPAPPVLRPVVVIPKTTALVVMDMNNTICSVGRRRRCVETLPAIADLVRRARARGVLIIFTVYGQQTRGDIASALGVRTTDRILRGVGPDKFMGTDLDALLKAKHIEALITVGTAAEGAVLSTAAGAALRGIEAIVPVDGMSSNTLYGEQLTAWYLANAPVISRHAVLTSVPLIKF